jgi:fumarylacetoacetase
MDPTTNPKLPCIIEVEPDSHFSIQNLPYGVFRRKGGAGDTRVGVAIGDHVLDLAAVAGWELFRGPILKGHGKRVFRAPSLNAFMALGPAAWRECRETVSALLSGATPDLNDDPLLRGRALVSMDDVEMLLPVEIGDYTDFYSSRDHAANLGTMFRGADNALPPNWLHIPIGYHGRSSSIVLSGTPIRRPKGQFKVDPNAPPTFGPTRELDFELETGFFIGVGNRLGEPVPVDDAPRHIFGMVLVNDWSARDIQRWEYAPLGPFLGKNFATSISPWVVPMDALAPFRIPGPKQDPEPLEYLREREAHGYDIHLMVRLRSPRMEEGTIIAESNQKFLYWTQAQQLAHHTCNGCNLRIGDLLASGTISGPDAHQRGSMVEIAWRGTKPIEMPDGTRRSWLMDGDELSISGWCEGDGYRVGFGEVTGVIAPA